MKKILLLLVFIIAGLTCGTGLYYYQSTKAISENSETMIIEIPKGSSTTAVGKILQEKALIKSAQHFRWYLRLTSQDANLKAGFFEIPPQVNLTQIAEILTSGREAHRKVSIPEGRASWEIYGILKKHYPNLDSIKWENLVHDKDFTHSLGVKAPNLEGWLFPDTHSLPMEADEVQLLKLLVEATKKCLKDIDINKPDSRFNELGGWENVLNLASIVEEETGNPMERPHIAGVFHNRLRQHIPLGADPTVRYIFRNLIGPIYKSQLASDNPYNTRRFAGLPPGPISSPGRKAIEATLYPMETKDLYFVAKDDGSGLHFFSTNLRQHNIYKEQAARNRGE
ncbi:MAG: endolytic transglycosylase MltG [Fibrobacter sp.]|nr:endolytic transglycosylase MltG [Fibrobacter sp.]